MRIDVIISVPRQRGKPLPRFCIVAFRLSSKKIKTLTYSEYRVWGPRSLVAAFPSVVEQVVQDHNTLLHFHHKMLTKLAILLLTPPPNGPEKN